MKFIIKPEIDKCDNCQRANLFSVNGKSWKTCDVFGSNIPRIVHECNQFFNRIGAVTGSGMGLGYMDSIAYSYVETDGEKKFVSPQERMAIEYEENKEAHKKEMRKRRDKKRKEKETVNPSPTVSNKRNTH